MDQKSPDVNDVILKYTLDKSEIALNCDHWNATDFAGAIDSGLLKYEGGVLQNENTPTFDPSGNTVTVFIAVSIRSSGLSLEAKDFSQPLIDALQMGACKIDVGSNHIVNIAIRGIITEHNIHHPE